MINLESLGYQRINDYLMKRVGYSAFVFLPKQNYLVNFYSSCSGMGTYSYIDLTEADDQDVLTWEAYQKINIHYWDILDYTDPQASFILTLPSLEQRFYNLFELIDDLKLEEAKVELKKLYSICQSPELVQAEALITRKEAIGR